MAAVHAGREPLLLWLVELALRVPAPRGHRHLPGRGPGPPPDEDGPGQTMGAAAHADRAARPAGVVQVLRLLRPQRDQRAGIPRRPRLAAAPPGRPPGGHLVLHVHGHQLRGGRVPEGDQARRVARLRGLPLVLPPPGGRAHRPGERAAAPGPDPAGSSPHRPGPRGLPHRLGPVQEGGHLELRGHRDRGPGVLQPEPVPHAEHPVRHLRLRGPDLRGLQRVHRHRHRHRPPAGVRVPPELRPARTRPGRCRTSGDAGTSPCPAGCATTCTSLSVARGAPSSRPTAT